jgi:fumarylacetoacetase
MEALMPFVCKGADQDPKPFEYLQHDDPYTFDINLDVLIKVPELGSTETVLARSNFKNMYWTMKQQLAHHTITGCNVRPGDLLASGTISGDTRDSYGSMLEITWRGKEPFLFDQEGKCKRVFLQDGDTITIKGFCQADGYRVGFGECIGTILPAVTSV